MGDVHLSSSTFRSFYGSADLVLQIGEMLDWRMGSFVKTDVTSATKSGRLISVFIKNNRVEAPMSISEHSTGFLESRPAFLVYLGRPEVSRYKPTLGPSIPQIG